MQPEYVDRLLRDGITIAAPTPEMRSTAGELEKLGLIQGHSVEYVHCADPEDRDYCRSNRHCPGRIRLGGAVDEYCCPECDRLVYATSDGKRRHRELRIEVSESGVVAYVDNRLEESGYKATCVRRGVFRIDTEPLGVFLCIADYCDDVKFLAREWASTQPTVYLTVNPLAAERFLNEAWLARVSLAELVREEVDLDDLIERTATSGPPTSVRHASVPVYTVTVRPQDSEGKDIHNTDRLFTVELDDGVVRIEGQRVIAAQALTRYRIFRVLWERFVEDLANGTPPEKFRATDIDTMLRDLQESSGKELVDELNIRRALNRLQTDIMEALRRELGLPIQRDDIVETCRWKGQARADHGYRLNPRRIAIRPSVSRL